MYNIGLDPILENIIAVIYRIICVINEHFDIIYPNTCSLYYKHTTIVNDASSFVSKWSSKCINNAIVAIYDCNMLIIQATDLNTL